MKKACLLCLLATYSCLLQLSFAQTSTIHFPRFKYANSRSLQLEKIERSDTATILHFFIQLSGKNSSMTIDTASYLDPNNGTPKIYMKGTRGMAVRCGEKWEVKDSTPIRFALIYPPLPKDLKKMHFIENAKSTWKIFDIELQEEARLLPEEIAGNWLDEKNNLTWIVGFQDSIAIYNNQIWHYGKVTNHQNEWTIELINEKEKIQLYVQNMGRGLCKIGTKATEAIICTKKLPVDALELKINNNIAPSTITTAPKNRAKIKIYLNDVTIIKPLMMILENTHGKFYALLHKDGYFQFDIPVMFPQFVSMNKSYKFNSYSGLGQSFYVTPGSVNTLFLDDNWSRRYTGKNLIRLSDKYKEPNMIMMGTNAYINNLMAKLSNEIQSIKHENFIKDSSYVNAPALYRKQVTEKYNQVLAKMLQLYSLNTINAAQLTLLKRCANASYAYGLLNYYQAQKQFQEAQVRKGNKTNFSYKYTSVNTDTGYRTALVKAFADSSILYELGYPSLVKYKMINNEEFGKPKPGMLSFINYLQQKGTVLTTEETMLYEQLNNAKDEMGTNDFDLEKLTVATQNFKTKYQSQLTNFNNNILGKTDLEYLQEYFQLPDWTHDMLLFEKEMSRINNIEDLTKDDLANKIDLAKSASYLKMLSNQIAINNSKPPIEGSVIAKLPTTTTENILQDIVDQHKGKFVIVTILQRELRGIFRMTEKNLLRELFKDAPIVFVNIGQDDEPEDAWKNYAKQIRGYHYRISRQDISFLRSKYNSIYNDYPLLFNKSGELVKTTLNSSYDFNKQYETLKELIK